MQFKESILSASSPLPSSQGPGAITLLDLQSGTVLAAFKQSSANAHCTAVCETTDGQGGFMLAAQADKSILNVYNFQKDQIALKIVLPEKLTCIAVDHFGEYCAGGTASGRIYLWEVASGILFNAWDAHYRRISVLKFTHDGGALISGSDDSGVSVWQLSSLLDEDLQNELPEPYCTLSDHTLPVTDIAIGVGAFPNCRVLTSSADHSVKLWDLAARTQLATFLFPHPIACLAFEPAERAFFAASSDTNGSIHEVRLFRRRDSKHGRTGLDALGGAGAEDIVRIGSGDANTQRLIAIGQPVTAIALSLTASLLLAGTVAGTVHLVDVSSQQLLRTFTAHKGAAVTHVAALLRPADLVGHVELSIGVGFGASREGIPVRPIAPFQRIRDVKSREKHEVMMILPPRSDASHDVLSYKREELLRDHACFVQPMLPTDGTAEGDLTAPSLRARVTELEAEVARLRGQLGTAKGVNDVMWETVVHRLVGAKSAQMLDSPSESSPSGADEHTRKRGRV